jgi:hypothetical protein
MPGDDRVRHCQSCNLNVYNFSAMTEREIRRLVAEREGRLCARLYRRSDGTILTQNCPVGLRALTRRLSRVAGAILSFMMPGFTGAQQVLAQSYSSTNSGDAALQVEVFAPTGGRITNATAILTDRSRGIRHEAKAGKDGRLVLRGSISGPYTLTVSSPGFRTDTRILELRNGQLLSLPVYLYVAASMGAVVEIGSDQQPDPRSLSPNSVPAPSRLAPKPVQH